MAETNSSSAPDHLPFPPLTKSHIMNCSYHSWHPRYRAITPKSRLIPLTEPFLNYLRADGIILPLDEAGGADWSDSDSGIFSSTENPDESEDEAEDVAAPWQEVHQNIKNTITELGGKVVPKLNWSAPKDATWINPTNSLDCATAGDVYLMLKSSDFITHDLEHAFDDTVEEAPDASARDCFSVNKQSEIPFHLVLRKWFQLNPSLEFRCFVRNRKLLAICQRDLNHFDFLFNLQDKLRDRIQDFFDDKLKNSFPDPSFVFDVYVPPPHERVWLVDINPWAQRTDPLLFSWLEILTMPEPLDPKPARTLTLPLRPKQSAEQAPETQKTTYSNASDVEAASGADPAFDLQDEDDSDVENIFIPEFRLIRKDDPEAYGFSTPQYSAHKLPRDVVDASRSGGSGLREFAEQWKEILARRQAEEAEESDEDER